jgi:hypothetical protein
MSYNEPPPTYTESEKPRIYHDTRARFASSDEQLARKLQQEYDSQDRAQQPSQSRYLAPNGLPPRPSSSGSAAGSSKAPIYPPGQQQQQQPQYPAQPSAAPMRAQASNVAPATVFHVYDTSAMFRGRELDITLGDKRSVAFHVAFSRGGIFSSRPDITVYRGQNTNAVLCTGYFHSGLSSSANIELAFPQAAGGVQIDRTGVWSRSYGLVLNGQPMTIKNTHHNGASRWSSGSMKLVDGNGRIWATFVDVSHRSIDKQGRISIEAPELNPVVIEQVVCSLVALSEKLRRQRNNSAAAGGSAGVAGGSSC